MSIMDMFRNIMPGAKPNTVGVTPATGVGDPAGNPTVPNSGTVVSDGSVAAIPAGATGDKSPLSEFAKLWETKDNSPKSFVPNINVDPAKITEATKNIDFSKAIAPELMTKALAGDANALMQVINSTAQASVAQSIGATAEIVKTALTQQADKFNTEFGPEMLRRADISRTLQTDNPLYNNPAIAPVLKDIEQQMAAAYPNASAGEVAANARRYFTDMAEQLVVANGNQIVKPGQGVNGKPTQTARKEEDWGKFFGDQG